jgi:hypothetical protein
MTRSRITPLVCLSALALAAFAERALAQSPLAPARGDSAVVEASGAPATPPEMVSTYSALADGILALKLTEENLVRSILAAANAHAQVQVTRAERAIAAKDAAAAKTALEAVAADVSQMATEGDSSVAAIRKRLLQGGHHHNAAGEAQGIFEEGFVIVTRVAKQKLLESSRAFAQMAGTATPSTLTAEWQQVQAVYAELAKPAK